VDHRNDLAIVGTLPEAHGEDIIAIGRYYLDAKTNHAEVAFVVRDKWQGNGIGSFLFKYLASIARRQGIAGFTAEVLKDNKPMLAILNNGGFKVRSALHEDVYSVSLDFE
jgi:GNAT superfamily N-acetyltransferase